MPARARLLAAIASADAAAGEEADAAREVGGGAVQLARRAIKEMPVSELPDGAVSVDVSHNALAVLELFAHERLAALTSLCASWNRIERIADGRHARRMQLVELHVAFNALTCLPDAVAHMPLLRQLVANDNTLTSLPANFGDLANSLCHLNVQYNSLTALPQSFGRLTRLAALSAAGNAHIHSPPQDVLLDGAKGVLAWFQEHGDENAKAASPEALRPSTANATALAHALREPADAGDLDTYTRRLLVDAGFLERGGSLDPDASAKPTSLPPSPLRALRPLEDAPSPFRHLVPAGPHAEPAPDMHEPLGELPVNPVVTESPPRPAGEAMPRRRAQPQAPLVGSFATAASRAARRSMEALEAAAQTAEEATRGSDAPASASATQAEAPPAWASAEASGDGRSEIHPAIGEDDALAVVADLLSRSGRADLSASVEAVLDGSADQELLLDNDDDNDDDDDDDDARASPFPDPPPTPPAESWPPGADPPKSFICPIELAVMRDPVVAADGQSYERRAIERWLVRHHTSPLTGERLASKELRPNFALKSLIGDFRDTARRAHAEAAST